MKTPEQTLEFNTGLGHQFKRNIKALNSAKTSLEDAYRSVHELGPVNYDVNQLLNGIAELIQKSQSLAHGAEEAYNQND